MHIKELEGGSEVADFTCGTGGANCEIKTGGKKATVSLWFNGPSLVEMETKGPDVIKRRFRILPANGTMEMEVIPIVPGGKTETYGFKRVQLVKPIRVTIFRRPFRGTLSTEPSVRVRRSILLGVAFAALLLIIGASAFAIWRNATAAQLRVAALHSAHLEAGNALATVRANVYLTGILTRDYLLDADPKHAPQYADQFLKIRMGTDDSFRVLAASAQSDQEKAALERLRLEVETQLDPTRIILDLTLRKTTPAARNFCGKGCGAGRRSWRSPAKLSG